MSNEKQKASERECWYRGYLGGWMEEVVEGRGSGYRDSKDRMRKKGR